MGRLTLAEAGTVVRVEGDLEAKLVAAGWEPVEEQKAAPKSSAKSKSK